MFCFERLQSRIDFTFKDLCRASHVTFGVGLRNYDVHAISNFCQVRIFLRKGGIIDDELSDGGIKLSPGFRQGRPSGIPLGCIYQFSGEQITGKQPVSISV